MIKTFKEPNQTVEFFVTDDDLSLVTITDNQTGALQVLSNLQDYDIELLMDFYEEFGADCLINTNNLDCNRPTLSM